MQTRSRTEIGTVRDSNEIGTFGFSDPRTMSTAPDDPDKWTLTALAQALSVPVPICVRLRVPHSDLTKSDRPDARESPDRRHMQFRWGQVGRRLKGNKGGRVDAPDNWEGSLLCLVIVGTGH